MLIQINKLSEHYPATIAARRLHLLVRNFNQPRPPGLCKQGVLCGPRQFCVVQMAHGKVAAMRPNMSITRTGG